MDLPDRPTAAPGAAPLLGRRERLRTLGLGSLGGGLEIYDFVVFTIFAAYLGRTFFPQESAAAQLTAVFAIFAVGNLVRPLGGTAPPAYLLVLASLLGALALLALRPWRRPALHAEPPPEGEPS